MPDVRTGQKLRIKADEWNAVRRAAGAVLPRSGGFGSALGVGPEKCIVRNDSDAALPQFAVVQLVDAAADAAEFRGAPPVVSAKPYEDEGSPFAILLQPLASGEIGLARHSGVFAARVQPSGAGGGYAMPSRGTTYLVQIDVGPVPLIGAQAMSQADADGLVWAIVVLGSGGSSSGPGVLDVVPCRVREAELAKWEDGVEVDIYANGFANDPTGTGTVYLPEIGTATKPVEEMAILAHRYVSFQLAGSEQGDEEGEPEQTEDEEE